MPRRLAKRLIYQRDATKIELAIIVHTLYYTMVVHLTALQSVALRLNRRVRLLIRVQTVGMT